MVSPCPGCDLVGRETHRLGSVLGGKSGDGGMEDAGFWYTNAEKLLAPLLFAAATTGASMADVVRWLDEEETSEVLLALELAGVPEALRAARASLGREERRQRVGLRHGGDSRSRVCRPCSCRVG